MQFNKFNIFLFTHLLHKHLGHHTKKHFYMELLNSKPHILTMFEYHNEKKVTILKERKLVVQFPLRHSVLKLYLYNTN